MTNRISKFIINTDNTDKQNVVWNMVASMSNSFQSMLLMLILTQQEDVVGASYIAIGFAVANLLMTIGKFGVRNYQVTDVEENYSFSTYLMSRLFTVAIMVSGCIVYGIYKCVFGSYTFEKLVVVELLCLYKIIESVEDVYHGRLQQKGCLCVASKIWAIRNIVFIIEFFLLYVITRNLVITLVIDIATTIILTVVLNHIPKNYYGKIDRSSKKDVVGLTVSCIAIAIATFLLMYISNAPKYIIDAYVTDEEQTKINILLMVIYVVTLLSNFMFNPIINKLAVLKSDNNYSEILRKLKYLCMILAGIVALGLIFAEIIGRKLLGWIYNVSLEDYRIELLLTIVSGGFIALINLFYMVIIMLRKQNVFCIIFTIATVVLVLAGRYVLVKYDFIGLCNFYNIVLCVVSTSLAGYSVGLMNKRRREYD